MNIARTLRAALMGLTLVAGPWATQAIAENVHIVRQGTERQISVAMNRAIVVESETPFAELSIANPQIADFSTLSDKTIYLLGKTPGITTLTLLDAEGRLITNVNVAVSPDISEFKERLRQILPGEKIEVRSANDGIVLSGTVSSAPKMNRAIDLANRYAPERVSNLMSVSGKQQVMLKVRFAEMQRSVAKSLSSSLAFGGTWLDGDLSTIGETGTWLNPGNGLGGAITVPDGTEGVLGLGFNVGSLQVGLLLEALEGKGVVRTLAEPNLTALSGQEATFLAGGEYPIPVAQDDDTITVDFKPFGVELDFVPRVMDDETINLELSAAVSSIDSTTAFESGGITIAGFRRRDTSTTVVLRDGESFAVAGLLQDDFRDNNAQVPWLGDVPVLGALFRSADYQRAQTELVIIVSAHLVTPTRGEALALPTDRVKLPSEADLFLNGRVEGSGKPLRGAAGEVAKQDFSGSYGYVMD